MPIGVTQKLKTSDLDNPARPRNQNHAAGGHGRLLYISSHGWVLLTDDLSHPTTCFGTGPRSGSQSCAANFNWVFFSVALSKLRVSQRRVLFVLPLSARLSPCSSASRMTACSALFSMARIFSSFSPSLFFFLHKLFPASHRASIDVRRRSQRWKSERESLAAESAAGTSSENPALLL